MSGAWKKAAIACALLLIAAVIVWLATGHGVPTSEPVKAESDILADENPVGPGPQITRVTIAAVGDVLMHIPIINSVHDPESDSYAFNEVFQPVEPYVSWPDYSIGNLETRMAGSIVGYRGYPRFNTPSDLAGHLSECGFDLVATANNHCLDWGWAGVVNTISYLDEAGLDRIGTFSSAEERMEPFIIDLKGIRVAFLNYTESTNGLTIQADYQFCYNSLDAEVVIGEASHAREIGAEFIIAVLHFGNEYRRDPSESQREIARQLCEGGVDAVIGSHPHVVQPIEILEVDRQGEPVECLVAYSLGNFISCQRDRYRDSGIILYVELEKFEDSVSIASVEYLPVWVQKAYVGGRSRYRVLPVHPEIGVESDIPLTSADQTRMQQVWDELAEHLASDDERVGPWDGDMLTEYPSHDRHL